MTERRPRHPMTLQPVLFELPGMSDVNPRTVVYRDSAAGPLTLDVWAPASPSDGPRGAVVFVSGFPDPAFEARVGCKVLEMAAYLSWARLVACSGLVAITYTNREPAADLAAVLHHVHQHAAALGVDRDRIGIWACSGNVPTGLGALLNGAEVPVACAALCYGYMFGAGAAATRIGFADPCAGRGVRDLRPGVPLLVVRAGGDQTPGLNATVDSFVAESLSHDRPVTLINHAGAPHAFDLIDDHERTREVIRSVLRFLGTSLSAA
ncbi:MAG TPA: hypothetical protein VLT47_06815 [Anaeromyxobacteraceae bacterium]|nr:hypothetical protein [Anaeromyxobacteraceae bacterium]